MNFDFSFEFGASLVLAVHFIRRNIKNEIILKVDCFGIYKTDWTPLHFPGRGSPSPLFFLRFKHGGRVFLSIFLESAIKLAKGSLSV